jgi:hypothetical protein
MFTFVNNNISDYNIIHSTKLLFRVIFTRNNIRLILLSFASSGSRIFMRGVLQCEVRTIWVKKELSTHFWSFFRLGEIEMKPSNGSDRPRRSQNLSQFPVCKGTWASNLCVLDFPGMIRYYSYCVRYFDGYLFSEFFH